MAYYVRVTPFHALPMNFVAPCGGFPLVPTKPRVFAQSCLPNRFSVSFHGSKIEVTVAKKAVHVHQWIDRIWRFYGNSAKHMSTIGLDTEWRPNLCPGENHPIATIQLCIGSHCLIYQLLHADLIPPFFHAFLADPRFTFCGVGIQDDVQKLQLHHGLHVGKTVDLNDLYKKKMGCDNNNGNMVGLKRMVSIVLNKEMEKPKRVTLSAWDAMNLDADQIEYAAIDAFVSSQLAIVLKYVSSES